MGHKRRAEISLDNTLRYLYYTIQVKGGSVLAIRFTYRGTEYVADTPEEAQRLRQLLEDSDYGRPKNDVGFRYRMNLQLYGWDESRFNSVMASIGRQQTKMLVALFLWQAIDAEDLAMVLGLSSQESLAGVISGLSKQLEKLGVKLGDVFRVQTHWVGKKKERYFSLSPGFDGAAAEFNWGHYWRTEEWAKDFEAKIKGMQEKRKPRKKGKQN